MTELLEGFFTSPVGDLWVRHRAGTSDWNTITSALVYDEYGLIDRVKPGDVVWDVGAHIGGVTLLALKLGASVVALEPVPDNVDLLVENARLNELHKHLVVLPYAAGASGRQLVRYNYAGNENVEHHAFVGNTYHVWETDPPEGVTYDEDVVRSVSLDELAAEVGLPDVIKLDCEGGEFEFLAGSERLRRVPLLVGEWHPVRGRTRAEFTRLLIRTHGVMYTGPESGPGGFEANQG